MTPLMAKGKCIVFLFLSVLFVFSNSFAAEPDSRIVDVQEKIQKTEDNIKFEKGWDKKLGKAKKSLESLQGANSVLSIPIPGFAAELLKGAIDDKLNSEIAKANSLLKPFFKLDKKGNLQWG
ncbi:MAG: hypothetical protein GY760_22540, partial [Deltaproteobacteria bacterium]|nr:hypothetical protein [Deltaproteobacteria bacterium]